MGMWAVLFQQQNLWERGEWTVILSQAPGFDVKNQDQTAQDAGTNSAETHGIVQLLAIDPSLAPKES